MAANRIHELRITVSAVLSNLAARMSMEVLSEWRRQFVWDVLERLGDIVRQPLAASAGSKPKLKEGIMRWILVVIGVLIALLGGLWFSQGIGIVLNSPMTNQSFWAIVGGVLLVFGILLMVLGVRRTPTI